MPNTPPDVVTIIRQVLQEDKAREQVLTRLVADNTAALTLLAAKVDEGNDGQVKLIETREREVLAKEAMVQIEIDRVTKAEADALAAREKAANRWQLAIRWGGGFGVFVAGTLAAAKAFFAGGGQ